MRGEVERETCPIRRPPVPRATVDSIIDERDLEQVYRPAVFSQFASDICNFPVLFWPPSCVTLDNAHAQ